VQRCLVALWSLLSVSHGGEETERLAVAADAVRVLGEHVAVFGEVRLAVVAGVLATDVADFGTGAVAAAHGLAATWRAAAVAEVRPKRDVTPAQLAAWAVAMVQAATSPSVRASLPGLPGVAVVLLELADDPVEPLRRLQRASEPRGVDSALRSVYVQHRLITGLPTLPGVAPATAKAVVQMVVERLLSLPGGLEPLMLLQQNGALLQTGIRVAVLTVLTARAAGWPDERLAALGAAALLHDLGSILDELRPGPSSFAWLLEHGTDDLWLGCALVARTWRQDHGALDEAGRGGLAAAALVRLAATIEAELRRDGRVCQDRIEAAARAGAFPAELVAVVPDAVFAEV
jgi:hypothetical protein